ncbi:MAG: hypothetical protein SO401_00710 [Blautia sp.]|nr:hypothetical protein [Blautia sp.]
MLNLKFKKICTAALSAIMLLNVPVYAETLNIVEAEGNVDQKFVDEANELINQVPEDVLQGFVDNGWKIYITDKNIAQTYFAGEFNSVKGVTDWDTHIIRIEDRPEAVETATVHEFGHYLDAIKGYVSHTPEFKQIYSEEGKTFADTFKVDFYYDNQEFFADGIYRYFSVEKDMLEENCPKLYNAICETLQAPDITEFSDH